MEVLILGAILQYMVSKLFHIGCIGLKNIPSTPIGTVGTVIDLAAGDLYVCRSLNFNFKVFSSHT